MALEDQHDVSPNPQIKEIQRKFQKPHQRQIELDISENKLID
jgi:hypothetical protein